VAVHLYCVFLILLPFSSSSSSSSSSLLLLSLSSLSVLAEPVQAEKLFFKDVASESSAASPRVVQAGEDVILECEAAGRHHHYDYDYDYCDYDYDYYDYVCDYSDNCEAAGRPSPIIYWEFDGIRLNPVIMHIIRLQAQLTCTQQMR